MRQWLVPPSIMCRKHLLGEHVEHHMFVGSLKKNYNLEGYMTRNLLEPKLLIKRHNELMKELIRRNYNHSSPLEIDDEIQQFMDKYSAVEIDKEAALQELLRRCKICRLNYMLTSS